MRNPLFARLLVRLRRDEPDEITAHRHELLAGLTGRVLEVGSGDGPNFPHFPNGVTGIVAVEPEPYLRAKARERAAGLRAPIEVIDALADQLPLGDGEADAAVVALVLCSVPDPRAALRELHRVVKPGGELRFYEHVAADRAGLLRVQRLLERSRIWPFLAGGCHPARDTVSAIEAAGFEIERIRRLSAKPFALAFPVAPHVLGVARRPG